MKKTYWTVLLLVLALRVQAGYAQALPIEQDLPITQAATASPAQATTTPVPTAQTSPTPENLHLGGKFGIGTDSLRFDYEPNGLQNITLTTSITALDAIWWLSDNDGLDILAAGGIGSNDELGFDGNPTNYPSDSFGFGLGYRHNLSSPLKDLKIQSLFRATYAHYDNTSDAIYNQNPFIALQTNTVSEDSTYLMAGFGFEYFMPFCESFSIQSYVVYALSYNDGTGTQNFNPNANQYGFNLPLSAAYHLSYWRSGFLVNGLTPSTVAVHFYF